MRLSRFLSLLLALMMALSLAPAMQAETLEFTDMADRAVKLDKAVQRIVALQPADCEVLFAIGAGDLLVGRGEYCDYPAEVLEVPSVQSGFETNYEQIIALAPDVVILTKMAQSVEDIKKLEEAGITVIVSDAQSIQGVYSAISMLGQITGKADEAAELVASMTLSFAELAEKAKDKEGGSVYFEVSPLAFGLWVAGAGTFMDEIATILNLKNAFDDIEGWQAISEEQVLTRDPDIIVTTTMYFGEGPTPVEELTGRTSWDSLKAVKNGRVFNADADAITRPGPRLVEAAQAFYDFLYGE
mgnify:FL=1